MDDNTEYLISIIYDDSKNKCRLVANHHSIITCIIQHFTTENTAAFFVEQYGYNISNEISVINALGYFDIGLFTLVYKALKMYYPNEDIQIINKDFILKKIVPLKNKLNITEILNISDVIKMRPYQIEAVKACLKYGRGIIECPTASGKSYIITNIIYNLNHSKHTLDSFKHTLIYVPNRQLVDQFYNDLLKYGYTKNDICKFTSNSGNKKNKNFEDNSCKNGFNPIIISNSAYINIHKNELPKIDAIFCDEVHKLSPNTVSAEFVRNLSTDIKIGFTGTVPKYDFYKWSLIGLFGPILFTETIVNLQQQEYLTPLKIISLEIFDYKVHNDSSLLFSLNTLKKFDKEDLNEDALKFNDAYKAEVEYINKNLRELYIKPLETICEDKENKNILILFDRIEFGKGIYEEAKNSLIDKDIHYIDGTIDINIRENIRKNFDLTNNSLLFAQSVTFSTGINIENLDCIVFFFSGKGFTKIIQSIGRTLRLHKDKPYAKLYDISFNYKYSQKHKEERMQIYNEAYAKTSYDEIIKIIL